jgi:hypothetical protein
MFVKLHYWSYFVVPYCQGFAREPHLYMGGGGVELTGMPLFTNFITANIQVTEGRMLVSPVLDI